MSPSRLNKPLQWHECRIGVILFLFGIVIILFVMILLGDPYLFPEERVRSIETQLTTCGCRED